MRKNYCSTEARITEFKGWEPQNWLPHSEEGHQRAVLMFLSGHTDPGPVLERLLIGISCGYLIKLFGCLGDT